MKDKDVIKIVEFFCSGKDIDWEAIALYMSKSAPDLLLEAIKSLEAINSLEKNETLKPQKQYSEFEKELLSFLREGVDTNLIAMIKHYRSETGSGINEAAARCKQLRADMMREFTEDNVTCWEFK